MSVPSPIRVVAIGSAHGDDAVAWHVIEQLRKSSQSHGMIETHRVDGGQRLLDLLDGQGTLVLIDAVRTGGTPGAVYRFDWPDARIESLRPGSTHEVSPAEALRLAQTLGSAPRRVIIFGVEIAEPGPLPGLSPQVRAAVPDAVAAVICEVQSLQASAARQN